MIILNEAVLNDVVKRRNIRWVFSDLRLRTWVLNVGER